MILSKSKAIAALFAAACFAMLVGLHLARPIQSGPDLVLTGFSADDICGYGDTETHCPNCVLAASVALPLVQRLPHALQVAGLRITLWFEDVPRSSLVPTPYSARSPPIYV